jgi:hypothetical protein
MPQGGRILAPIICHAREFSFFELNLQGPDYIPTSRADLIFSSLSLGFQKPNNLHYRNLMDNHGQALVQNESSAEISSLIKLQRLAERVAENHSSKESTSDAQMEALTAEVNIQMLLNELQEWRMSTPDAIRSLRKCFRCNSVLRVQ